MSAISTREFVPATTQARRGDDSAPPTFTREQIVDRILSMNHTASIDFLSSFSDRALRLYMDHLQAAALPRGRNARWVRPNDTRAVTMHESVD